MSDICYCEGCMSPGELVVLAKEGQETKLILTDLIAELRTVNSEANLPPFDDMADRAEARLREVQGE